MKPISLAELEKISKSGRAFAPAGQRTVPKRYSHSAGAAATDRVAFSPMATMCAALRTLWLKV